MKESDLYPPVRDWLRARGYTIYVERFDADIVAVKDGRLLAVELKLCFTQQLYSQLQARATWADEVMAAVGSAPRAFKAMRYMGYGLLLVSNGKVRQKFKTRPQPWQFHKRRLYRLKVLADELPAMDHELAGVMSVEAGLQRAKRFTP